MSSSPLPTSRNPKVKCKQCDVETELYLCMKEEFMAAPYQKTVEGLIICPNCGLRTHSYYISEKSRAVREHFNLAVGLFQKRQTKVNFNRAKSMREKFQNAFDADQEKFKRIMEKAAGEDGD